MKLEVTKEQLELLEFMIQEFEYQDSELLEDFEDLFEVYDIIGEIKNEYEKKLEIAKAKQPKAEW